MRRIQADRGEYRHHFAQKEIFYPDTLDFIPVCSTQKTHTLRRQRGDEILIKYQILFFDNLVRLIAHPF